MKATILDTKTGLIGVQDSGCRGWDYAEGNSSCDCNRDLWGVLDDSCYCNGSNRFLVIAAEYQEIDEDERYTLTELNEDYPSALLERWASLLVNLSEATKEDNARLRAYEK